MRNSQKVALFSLLETHQSYNLFFSPSKLKWTLDMYPCTLSGHNFPPTTSIPVKFIKYADQLIWTMTNVIIANCSITCPSPNHTIHHFNHASHKWRICETTESKWEISTIQSFCSSEESSRNTSSETRLINLHTFVFISYMCSPKLWLCWLWQENYERQSLKRITSGTPSMGPPRIFHFVAGTTTLGLQWRRKTNIGLFQKKS